MSAPFTPTALNCDEVRAALGAHALGILEPDEDETVENHLDGCASCREALSRELASVGALALAVRPVAPSADARSRLMAAATAAPETATAEPVSLEMARGALRLRRMLLPAVSVAAAVLLIVAGILGVLLNRAVDDRDEARNVAELLSTYVSSGGDVVTMRALESSIYEYYEGQGSLLTAPGMEPVVVVADCPKSGKSLTYWVWFGRDGERVRAGKLVVGENGSGWLKLYPDQPLSEFDEIGITVQFNGDRREDVLVAPLDSEPAAQG